jgi:hypothetical protein
VILVALLLGVFIFLALDRSRWSFNIDKTGFKWGGFIKTGLPFANVQKVYVNEEYVKPILVIERKGTI